jgi:uncharacterized protein involved in outer membrane biogenesis
MLLAAGVLLYGDLVFLRAPVERAATAAIGREVRIGGPINLSLLPNPGVDVHRIEVANPDWAEDPLLLRVERLRIETDLSELMAGRLHLTAIGIQGAGIDLERGPQGYSWPELPKRAEPEGGGAEATAASISLPERISVRDLELVLRSKGAPTHRLVVHQADWRYAPASGIALEAALLVAGRDLGLKAEIAALGPETWRVDAEARSDEDRLHLKLPEARLSGPLAGTLEFAGSEFAGVLSVLGVTSDALGPYSLNSEFVAEPGSLHIPAVAARVGKSKVDGALQVELDGTRPRITGELKGERIALQPWYGLRPTASPDAESSAEPALSGFARLLAGVDLDVGVRVAQLTGTGVPFSDVNGRVTIAGGTIRVPKLSAATAGHALTATGSIRVEPPVLLVEARAAAGNDDAHARISIEPGRPVRLSGELRAQRLSETLLRDIAQAVHEAHKTAGSKPDAGNPLAPVALDLGIEVRELTVGKELFSAVAARARSDAQSLRAESVSARSGPTRFEGEAQLRWQAGRMELAAEFDADRWALGQTLRSVPKPERLRAQGERLTARASARGADAQALLRDLRWKIDAQQSALYFRPKRGQPIEIELGQAQVQVSSAEGLRLQAALRSQSVDLAMELHTVAPRTLRDKRDDIPLSVSLRLPRSELHAEGTAAIVDDVPRLRLALTGRGEDLEALSQLLQIPLHVRSAFETSATLQMDATTFKIRDFRYESETAKGHGEVGFEWGRTRPLLTVAIDLDRFVVPDSRVPLEAQPEAESPQPSGRVIPDTPLRLAGLRDFDADVEMNVRSAVVGETDLGRFGIDALLRDGQLSLTRLYGTFAGGEIGVSGWIDAKSSPPVLALQGGFNGFDYGAMLKARGVTQAVEGQLDIGFDLSGSGDSPRALAAVATGHLTIVGSKGVLPSALLNLWAGDLAMIVLPTNWQKAPQTRLNCVVTRFEIQSGVAVADAILIDTDSTVIAGAGQIDLRSEQVTATFKPQAKDPTLFSLATPMVVQGPLSDPEVRPSETGTVTTLGKLAIGVANPATLLLFFSDAGAGDANRCAAAVEALDAKGTVATQRRREPIRGVIETLLSPFRRLGKSLEDQAPAEAPAQSP